MFVEALGARLAAAGLTFAPLSETPAARKLVGGSARAGFRLDTRLVQHRVEALDLGVAPDRTLCTAGEHGAAALFDHGIDREGPAGDRDGHAVMAVADGVGVAHAYEVDRGQG